MPPAWEVVKQKMIAANQTPEQIQAAQGDYQRRFGGGDVVPADAQVVSAPSGVELASQPIRSFSSSRVGSAPSLTTQGFTPAVEELKKLTEYKINADNTTRMIDKIYDMADQWIPAADMVDIGGIETGIMGKIQGLQRMITIPTGFDERAAGFEDVKQGFTRMIIRGLGEKGVLTKQDVEHATRLLPATDDSVVRRETKKEGLKKFLDAQFDTYNRKIVSLTPGIAEQFDSFDKKTQAEFLAQMRNR